MPGQVTRIKPLPVLEKPKRVAAYARVSSEKDAMLHSLSAQVSHYSNLIQSHPGWIYAGVYTDEARTGTKEDRAGFQRLLADCHNGRIDLILTKSISRFARNTVTTLERVRELRQLGIDVYFENENIHTQGADGEFMLTIMASYAQEQSRSASENQKWSIRKKFEQGELACWRHMFGYRITKGKVEINPEEAAVVRELYRRVIDGASLSALCRWLNREHLYGAMDGKWQTPRLRDLLQNEKYLGNALLQKTYKNNHIEKKKLPNHGEYKQYFATETHPLIVDQETFDAAQAALARIALLHPAKKSSESHLFTGMIQCGHCGKNYRFIRNHGMPRYACPTYLVDGKDSCPCRKTPEELLIKKACELFGWDHFQPEAFHRLVHHITAVYPDTLIFHLQDGSDKETTWENRSRSESWTPEMREQAAESMRRRWHG